VIETIRQGLKAEGIHVSMSKLCQWFGVSRRTLYYRPTKTILAPASRRPMKAQFGVRCGA
jgi:putative transposase